MINTRPLLQKSIGHGHCVQCKWLGMVLLCLLSGCKLFPCDPWVATVEACRLKKREIEHVTCDYIDGALIEAGHIRQDALDQQPVVIGP